MWREGLGGHAGKPARTFGEAGDAGILAPAGVLPPLRLCLQSSLCAPPCCPLSLASRLSLSLQVSGRIVLFIPASLPPPLPPAAVAVGAWPCGAHLSLRWPRRRVAERDRGGLTSVPLPCASSMPPPWSAMTLWRPAMRRLPGALVAS